MIHARALFLADGSSDEPIGAHIAALAHAHGVVLEVVTPEFARMDNPPGRTVRARLERVLGFDAAFQVLVVHRDSEGSAASLREAEIESGCRQCGVGWPAIPVVPIRMTEAWLLLDEHAIRTVAGRPSSSEPLGLPTADQAEVVADPKALLQSVLEAASGQTGRRLRQFRRDFSYHRRQLLERLDRDGVVRQLSAWQALEAATENAMRALVSSQTD